MENFYRLIRLLKKAYPQYRVTVRRVKQNAAGHCWRPDVSKPNEYRITIRRDLNLDSSCDALIHEFAHCPGYDEWERTGDEHNPVWAYHHGECYKIFETHCT